MEYGFMIIAIIFSVMSNMILHKFRNRSFKTPGDVFWFNAGISCMWFLVLSVWTAVSGSFEISAGAVGFGVVYGVILCLFLYCKTQAMATGPVALTSLIANCAFIIATWFGVIYADEKVLPLQIFGMIVIVFALFLCINPGKSDEELTPRWFVWCAAFFLMGGFLGIFNKIFGKSSVSDQINSMMLVASVVSFVMFMLFGALINISKKCDRPKIYRESIPYIISCGLVGCIYIRMNLWLAGVIPSVIFFPVSNGANVLLSTLLGRVAFNERLKKIQVAGILIGLGAIILIGCPQLFVN